MDGAGDSAWLLAAILESEGDEEEEVEEEEEDSEEAEEADGAAAQQHPDLVQEMDEAKQKLAEFEQVSQALLAELSALEAEVQIEKTCRQQAEAYAAQVEQENVQLKRLSLALPPGPEQPPGPEPVPLHGQPLRDLQEQLSRLLAQKRDLTAEVQELQGRNRELQEQLERVSGEKEALRAALDRSQRALTSFKRVSQLVSQDYREAVQQLELEQALRLHAEAFAHQMLVEKKEANRQSAILLQSAAPGAQLLRALEDVGSLTRALEEAKQEHRRQVQALREELEARPAREELEAARAALDAAQRERAQLQRRLQDAQRRLDELEEKVTASEEPPMPAVPPPPPPLPPPPPAVPADPLAAIRRRKGQPKAPRERPDAEDAKARAVQEMMERIRSGVVLRPAAERPPRQGPAGGKRRSAALELRSILSTARGSGRTRGGGSAPGWRRSSGKGRDGQLQSILQRRRRAVDAAAESAEQEAPAGSPARPGDAGACGSVRFRPRASGGLPRSRPAVRLAEGRSLAAQGQPLHQATPEGAGEEHPTPTA